MHAKRCFDALGAAVALAVLMPVLLLTALMIRMDSPGPALFGQRRVGRDGRLFTIWKFRTMRHGSSGALLSAVNDPRVTRLGRHLRTYRIDELPQLFNVLIGEMSFVGPRPELPKYVSHYPADVRQRILAVRPGITDRAAIAFRNEAVLLAGEADPEAAYVERILPEKLRHHLAYVNARSFLGDLRIICDTIRAVVSDSGR